MRIGETILLFNTEQPEFEINFKEINGNNIIYIEDLWYETNYLGNKNNYVIGVVYKHPGCTVDCPDYFS